MIIATEEAEDLGDVKSQIIESVEQVTCLIALRASMRNLVLSDCDLWDAGVKPIFETLIDGDRYQLDLISLNLSGKNLTEEVFAEIVQKLTDRIDPNTSRLQGDKRLKLNKIDMSWNKI